MASNKRTVIVEAKAVGLKERIAELEKIRKQIDDVNKKKIHLDSSGSTASIDQTTKSVGGLTNSMAAAATAAGVTDRAYKGVAQATSNGTKEFAKMSQGMGGLVHAYASVAANAFALTAAFSVLKRAADVSNVVSAQAAMSAATGNTLSIMTKGLKRATDGALSLAQASKAASLAAASGFDSQYLERLGKVARGASIALGRDLTDSITRLTTGIAKMEPEILDELGIFVKIETATKKYADSIGKTRLELTEFERRQAFATEALLQGEAAFQSINASTKVNPYDELTASLSDLLQSSLEFANSNLGGIMSTLANSAGILLGVMVVGASKLVSLAVPALEEYSSKMALAALNADKLATSAKYSAQVSAAAAVAAKGAIGADAVEALRESFSLLDLEVSELSISMRDSTLVGRAWLKEFGPKFTAEIERARAEIEEFGEVQSGMFRGKNASGLDDALDGIYEANEATGKLALITENAGAKARLSQGLFRAYARVVGTEISAAWHSSTASIAANRASLAQSSMEYSRLRTKGVSTIMSVVGAWKVLNASILASTGSTSAFTRTITRGIGIASLAVKGLGGIFRSLLGPIGWIMTAWSFMGEGLTALTKGMGIFSEGVEELEDAIENSTSAAKTLAEIDFAGSKEGLEAAGIQAKALTTAMQEGSNQLKSLREGLNGLNSGAFSNLLDVVGLGDVGKIEEAVKASVGIAEPMLKRLKASGSEAAAALSDNLRKKVTEVETTDIDASGGRALRVAAQELNEEYDKAEQYLTRNNTIVQDIASSTVTLTNSSKQYAESLKKTTKLDGLVKSVDDLAKGFASIELKGLKGTELDNAFKGVKAAINNSTDLSGLDIGAQLAKAVNTKEALELLKAFGDAYRKLGDQIRAENDRNAKNIADFNKEIYANDLSIANLSNDNTSSKDALATERLRLELSNKILQSTRDAVSLRSERDAELLANPQLSTNAPNSDAYARVEAIQASINQKYDAGLAALNSQNAVTNAKYDADLRLLTLNQKIAREQLKNSDSAATAANKYATELQDIEREIVKVQGSYGMHPDVMAERLALLEIDKERISAAEKVAQIDATETQKLTAAPITATDTSSGAYKEQLAIRDKIILAASRSRELTKAELITAGLQWSMEQKRLGVLREIEARYGIKLQAMTTESNMLSEATEASKQLLKVELDAAKSSGSSTNVLEAQIEAFNDKTTLAKELRDIELEITNLLKEQEGLKEGDTTGKAEVKERLRAARARKEQKKIALEDTTTSSDRAVQQAAVKGFTEELTKFTTNFSGVLSSFGTDLGNRLSGIVSSIGNLGTSFEAFSDIGGLGGMTDKLGDMFSGGSDALASGLGAAAGGMGMIGAGISIAQALVPKSDDDPAAIAKAVTDSFNSSGLRMEGERQTNALISSMMELADADVGLAVEFKGLQVALRELNASFKDLAGGLFKDFGNFGEKFAREAFGAENKQDSRAHLFSSKSRTEKILSTGISIEGSIANTGVDPAVASKMSELFSVTLSNSMAYALVQVTRESSGFIGIGGGVKSSVKRHTEKLSDALIGEFEAIFSDTIDTVVDVVSGLAGFSFEDMAARLTNLINTGAFSYLLDGLDIDLLGKDGEGTYNTIAAFFNEASETTIMGLVPHLQVFQRAGEELGDTLARLVSQAIGLAAAVTGILPESYVASITKVNIEGPLKGIADSLVDETKLYLTNFRKTEVEQYLATAGVRAPDSAAVADVVGLRLSEWSEDFRADNLIPAIQGMLDSAREDRFVSQYSEDNGQELVNVGPDQRLVDRYENVLAKAEELIDGSITGFENWVGGWDMSIESILSSLQGSLAEAQEDRFVTYISGSNELGYTESSTNIGPDTAAVTMYEEAIARVREIMLSLGDSTGIQSLGDFANSAQAAFTTAIDVVFGGMEKYAEKVSRFSEIFSEADRAEFFRDANVSSFGIVLEDMLKDIDAETIAFADDMRNGSGTRFIEALNSLNDEIKGGLLTPQQLKDRYNELWNSASADGLFDVSLFDGVTSVSAAFNNLSTELGVITVNIADSIEAVDGVTDRSGLLEFLDELYDRISVFGKSDIYGTLLSLGREFEDLVDSAKELGATEEDLNNIREQGVKEARASIVEVFDELKGQASSFRDLISGSIDDFSMQLIGFATNLKKMEVPLSSAMDALAGTSAAKGLKIAVKQLDKANDAFSEFKESLNIESLSELIDEKSISKAYQLLNDITTRTNEKYSAELALLQEQADQIQESNEALRGTKGSIDQLQKALDSFADFLRGLNLGSLSILSPKEILEGSKGELDRLLGELNATDDPAKQAELLGEIQGAATKVLELSKDYFAGTAGYVRDFNEITALLSSLNIGFSDTPESIDAQIEANTAKLAALGEAALLLSQQHAEELLTISTLDKDIGANMLIMLESIDDKLLSGLNIGESIRELMLARGMDRVDTALSPDEEVAAVLPNDYRDELNVRANNQTSRLADVYREFLGRDIGVEGLDYWGSQIVDGILTFEQVRDAVKNSEEAARYNATEVATILLTASQAANMSDAGLLAFAESSQVAIDFGNNLAAFNSQQQILNDSKIAADAASVAFNIANVEKTNAILARSEARADNERAQRALELLQQSTAATASAVSVAQQAANLSAQALVDANNRVVAATNAAAQTAAQATITAAQVQAAQNAANQLAANNAIIQAASISAQGTVDAAAVTDTTLQGIVTTITNQGNTINTLADAVTTTNNNNNTTTTVDTGTAGTGTGTGNTGTTIDDTLYNNLYTDAVANGFTAANVAGAVTGVTEAGFTNWISSKGLAALTGVAPWTPTPGTIAAYAFDPSLEAKMKTSFGSVQAANSPSSWLLSAYWNGLGRYPDKGGAEWWQKEVDEGRSSVAAASNAIANSPEADSFHGLRGYALGGIANTASIFGEAGPEAAVPLPDGRRIPVDLGGVSQDLGAKIKESNMVLVEALNRQSDRAEESSRRLEELLVEANNQENKKALLLKRNKTVATPI